MREEKLDKILTSLEEKLGDSVKDLIESIGE